MPQQLLAGTAATLFGGDVQVFQVDAITPQPGRIAIEVHRITNGLAVTLADQPQGLGAVIEQGTFDIGNRGNHFVASTLILGKLGNEREDSGGVIAAGRADVQGHDWLPWGLVMAHRVNNGAGQRNAEYSMLALDVLSDEQGPSNDLVSGAVQHLRTRAYPTGARSTGSLATAKHQHSHRPWLRAG
ncbi:hypothetical protein D3C72_1767580 [compost metagenome]